MTKEFNMR